MSAVWTDGTWTAAYAVTGPVFSSPIPNTTAQYVLEQDFMQLRANWTPLALNTPHTSSVLAYPQFRLVSEGPRADMGEGICRWTRTYAKVPDSWSEQNGTVSYNFIGYLGTGGVNVPDAVPQRERFVKVVPVRLQRDYFLTGPGGDYLTDKDIPLLEEQEYYYPSRQNGEVIHVPVDYLNSKETIVITPGGSEIEFDYDTIPSRKNYKKWVKQGSEIIPETSHVARWMGNIFVRETRYIVAQ